MNSSVILEKNPLSAELVRRWFTNKMFESIQNDTTVPQEFKDYIMSEGVSNESLSIFIDSNPRSLFDLFDEYKIFICISVWTKTPGDFENAEFGIALNANNKNNNNFSSRKEAEVVAIEEAFELLEEKLKE